MAQRATKGVSGDKAKPRAKKPKATSQVSGEVKKRRNRPGALALREIRRYQKNTNLVVRKLPFQRLVRELVKGNEPDFRISTSALAAFQETTEMFIGSVFEDSQLCTLHAKRQTLMAKDMMLAKRIRGDRYGRDAE